jgi:hypothetical protein
MIKFSILTICSILVQTKSIVDYGAISNNSTTEVANLNAGALKLCLTQLQ